MTAFKHSYKSDGWENSLYVQNTGRQQCAPGDSWGPGVRNHYLIHYVISGSGYYICNGNKYHLREGDTFLAYPDTLIHYYADEEDPWEYTWVGFNGTAAAQIMAQTDFAPENLVFYRRDSHVIYNAIDAIYRNYGSKFSNTLNMVSKLYRFLGFLVESSGNSKLSDSPEWDCAQVAAEYIMSHYEQPLTIEALAEFACVSQSSLYRKFKAHYGKSPKQYLMEYRIDRAIDLMKRGGITIQEIAASVGFEDPLYFSRAFKELVGMSPRRYMETLGVH